MSLCVVVYTLHEARSPVSLDFIMLFRCLSTHQERWLQLRVPPLGGSSWYTIWTSARMCATRWQSTRMTRGASAGGGVSGHTVPSSDFSGQSSKKRCCIRRWKIHIFRETLESVAVIDARTRCFRGNDKFQQIQFLSNLYSSRKIVFLVEAAARFKDDTSYRRESVFF